jgi:hypothetical protein
VSPFQEEARVEAGRTEAAQIVLELASVANHKVLEITKLSSYSFSWLNFKSIKNIV